MGWSCAIEAARALDAFSEACIKSTGSQNTWEERGKRYFFETGREHEDGAITGTVFRIEADGRCYRSGSFRIEADGTVKRAPRFLKRAAASTEPKGCPCCGRTERSPVFSYAPAGKEIVTCPRCFGPVAVDADNAS